MLTITLLPSELPSERPKGAPGDFVERFDFIYGVEDFGAVHCFDVINAAL